MTAMAPLRQQPAQRHAQLRDDFIKLTNERLDMVPDSREYEAQSTRIDQVLASVWMLGTVYSRAHDGFGD